MNILQDIIERCHQRQKSNFRQRRTVITPALYKSVPYHFEVHCSRGYPLMLDKLEQADISFMPIGRAPEGNDHGPKDLGGDRFLKRQTTDDWHRMRWFASWGIQIYTGIPSERDDARWHDINFTYQAICDAPDAVITCIETLIKITAKPLLTMTKSGGLRFSCRVPEYLHPDTDTAKCYIYKHSPTPENPHHRDVYLEILGENGYSQWDARYEILLGNLLEPPVIAKELLFPPIDTLRDALHKPDTSGETLPISEIAAPESLGSENLDLAKDAFLKRGFSYLQQDNNFHHWIHHGNADKQIYAWLWEDQDTVWGRASVPISGLCINGMPITDIWEDTGIPTPTLSTGGIPVTDRVIAVHEGKLSPLAIKRLPPLLSKEESTEKVYGTHKEKTDLIRRAYRLDARIIGINTETGPGTDYQVSDYIRSGGSTCLNIPIRQFAEATEQIYKSQKIPSIARWKGRMHQWDEVKNIPIDERMANPFQHDNPCEDPVRCRAIEYKGGDPQETICPECPVYTECQQRGYLSQPNALQLAKAQISTVYQLFYDPQSEKSLEQIFDPTDETERVCILDERKTYINDMFLKCDLPISVLEGWEDNWRGHALAHFAKALRNALQPQSQPYNNPISRIRATVQAFGHYEDEIIRQMCHVNMRGKVVEQSMVDAETKEELARFCIEFESGVVASIPLNSDAEDRLRKNKITCLSPDSFELNEDIEIPMSMTEAITLGILNTETVESILAFPTVSNNPNWTTWHQLKRFFAHYTRDADAPVRWDNEIFSVYVPPVLHPKVKRHLVISPGLSEHHLRRMFPTEKIEFVHTKPTEWISGNRVFQLRNHICSHHRILNHDNEWDMPSLSKLGERFFFGIRTEIDRDPNVKHAIITNKPIVNLLADLKEKENVCFIRDLKTVAGSVIDFQEAQVIWIVGIPHFPRDTICWHTQMLFGNDTEPLNYEGSPETAQYKDKRVQGVFLQNVTGTLIRAIQQIGLNRYRDKQLVLLTSLELPNITDRPETLLFDWEDFEVAGGIHKLPETIATRKRYEHEFASITGTSNREKVKQLLGCSLRNASYVLQQLRGGKRLRVPFKEQIFTLLAEGETKTAEIIESIEGNHKAIDNELRRLVELGEIIRVKRGVYRLPD